MFHILEEVQQTLMNIISTDNQRKSKHVLCLSQKVNQLKIYAGNYQLNLYQLQNVKLPP